MIVKTYIQATTLVVGHTTEMVSTPDGVRLQFYTCTMISRVYVL